MSLSQSPKASGCAVADLFERISLRHSRENIRELAESMTFQFWIHPEVVCIPGSSRCG